jgi:hypothetical protein
MKDERYFAKCLLVAGYVRCCAGAGYLEASYDDNKSVWSKYLFL